MNPRAGRAAARDLVRKVDAIKVDAHVANKVFVDMVGSQNHTAWTQYIYSDRVPRLDTFIRFADALGYQLELVRKEAGQ